MNKTSTKTKKHRLLSFLIVLISALFFSSTAIIFSLMIINNDSIYNGIYIEGVNVSGLTSIEATTKIEERLLEDIQNNKLKLRYADRMWVFSSEEIGLKHDFKRAIDEAVSIGREGNYFNRIISILRLIKNPQIINIKSKVDVSALNSILDVINQEIYVAGAEATIERINGEFIIHEGKVGVSLNRQSTFSKILHELNNSNYNETVEVDIVIDTLSPRITAENLTQIQHLLGSFSTKFNSNVIGRTHNIRLSSKAINGKVFLPGEVFSFNKVVGPRSIQNGYKDAPVIISGDLVDGLGGGVCQVSSTIYNSVLLSDLEIVERTNHSIPSTYVSKGLDATVSYGYLDFKFRNTSQYPIFIESYVKGNTLTVNIYGYKSTNKEVKLYSKVDQVIKRNREVINDPTLLIGREIIKERGRDGYRVSSYMDIYENGAKAGTKLISRDYYKPEKQILIRGTKKPEVIKQEDDEDTEVKIEKADDDQE